MMKKVWVGLITVCISMLMAFSVTASPLEGFDKAPVTIEMNKNQIKSLVKAPETPVSVAKSTNLADKAILKLLSDKFAKTSSILVSGSRKGLSGSKCGADTAYKPRNHGLAQWNKRPIPRKIE